MHSKFFLIALAISLAMLGCDDDASPAGLGLTVPDGAGGGIGSEAGPPGGTGGDAGPLSEAGPVDAFLPPDFGAPGPESPSPELIGLITDHRARVSLFARNLDSGDAVAVAADDPVPGHELFRFFVVLAYADKVAAGALDPESERAFTAPFLRDAGGRLGDAALGMSYKLSTLASMTLLSGDRSAEEMLLAAVGGAQTVTDIVRALSIDGLGEYLGPCAYDRAYAQALDARFANVGCPELARFIHNDEAAGISPDPFPQPPEFTTAQKAAAWATVWDANYRVFTARAWGEVLTRLHVMTLLSRDASERVRDLLDRSLGSWGGGDALPPETWVGAMQTSILDGRHWTGLISGGAAPLAVVMITHSAQPGADAGGFFSGAGKALYEQLVGPVDLTPPPQLPVQPDWLSAVVVLEADDSVRCNEQHPDNLEQLIACRRAAARNSFVKDERSAGSIAVSDAPQVDVAWFWTEPDGLRHRYQVRLDSGGWWVWTRSYPCREIGNWRLDMYVNGAAALVHPFAVTN